MLYKVVAPNGAWLHSTFYRHGETINLQEKQAEHLVRAKIIAPALAATAEPAKPAPAATPVEVSRFAPKRVSDRFKKK